MFLFALSCCQVCKRKHSSSHCLFFWCCSSYQGIIIWIGINVLQGILHILFLISKGDMITRSNSDANHVEYQTQHVSEFLENNNNACFWYNDFVIREISICTSWLSDCKIYALSIVWFQKMSIPPPKGGHWKFSKGRGLEPEIFEGRRANIKLIFAHSEEHMSDTWALFVDERETKRISYSSCQILHLLMRILNVLPFV